MPFLVAELTLVYGRYNIIYICMVFWGFINQRSHKVWGHRRSHRIYASTPQIFAESFEVMAPSYRQGNSETAWADGWRGLIPEGDVNSKRIHIDR